MQAAQLANQLGGREVWLAARLVCWLVGWLGGLVVLTSLPSAISLLVSRDAFLSLSLSVFALLYFFFSFFSQFCSILSYMPSSQFSFG